MPQLDTFSYFSTVIYLILIFLALVFIMHTYILPKIAQTLKIRGKLSAKLPKESLTKPLLTKESNLFSKLILTITTNIPKTTNK
jgi:hypothetical protein